MLLWANAYVIQNRVDVPAHLLHSKQRLSAKEIPISSYFPTLQDADTIRERMTTIVSRILVQHLKYFSAENVTRHIAHQYSKESTIKSELVNLMSVSVSCVIYTGSLRIEPRSIQA